MNTPSLLELERRIAALERNGSTVEQLLPNKASLGAGGALEEPGLTAENEGAPGNLLERVSQTVGKWVSPLTAKLIEQIEARTWKRFNSELLEAGVAKILTLEASRIAGETAVEGALTIKRLRIAEAFAADESNLVAGAQEVGEPAKSMLIWKVTGAIAAEVTAIKAEGLAAGTLLLLVMRMTAGTKITLVSRAAGVLEQNRFNLPENLNKVIEGGAAVTAHTLLLLKTNQGWQLVPGG